MRFDVARASVARHAPIVSRHHADSCALRYNERMPKDPDVPNPATLDLIFEHVKDAPEKQLQDLVDLDTKAMQVFAGASVILGAGALIDTKHGGGLSTTFLIVALAAYLVIAFLSFRGLRTRQLRGSRYADTLWKDFKDDLPEVVKLGIVTKVAEDYAYNRDVVIRGKAKLLNVALYLTALEAMFVATAVLISRLVS